MIAGRTEETPSNGDLDPLGETVGNARDKSGRVGMRLLSGQSRRDESRISADRGVGPDIPVAELAAMHFRAAPLLRVADDQISSACRRSHGRFRSLSSWSGSSALRGYAGA